MEKHICLIGPKERVSVYLANLLFIIYSKINRCPVNMAKLEVKQYRIFILSAVLWLVMDIVFKYCIFYGHIGQITIIKDFFYFTLQFNKGVAFGIHLGYAFQIIVSVIILALLIYFGIKYLLPQKRNSFINQFLLGIIIGGAIGNMVNRVHLGYVIDHIVLKPLPVFNIADIGITLGLIILFLLTYKQKSW